MSMAMMVAMASRQKRDEGGRNMEGGNNRRMEGDYYRPEGNYSMTYDDMEMRRRRDSRGRYMEHEGGSRMEYGGAQENYDRMEDEPEMRRRRDSRGRYMETEPSGHYMPWPEPHIPPHLIDAEMRAEPVQRDMDRHMMATPHTHMRDRNIVNIRDYQDRRRIGFDPNHMGYDEEDPEMRQYGRRYDPDRPKMHYGVEHQPEHMMGHMESYGSEHLTREEAEKWVKGMKAEDGKVGGRWPYQEIKQYAANFGIMGDEKIIEFYAVMNALYTDYCKIAKKYGVDKVDFWADLAKAFMDDKDANPGKVKMYYECIAKKDDE